ncbi:MAG: DUF1273 domain-containing protein [Eubacteriaceae bacterium]|nr:DUF1273 domain-containing protein [Eubacteriaceae bacterium]
MKTCCFTGHRSRIFPFSQTDERCGIIKKEMKMLIEAALNDGFNHFIVGGASGVDEWALEILREMKTLVHSFSVTLAPPYPGFTDVTQGADEIIPLSSQDDPSCFFKRNMYMVDNSQRIIAVYDEAFPVEGGTLQTLNYAKTKQITIEQLRWKKLLDGYYLHIPEKVGYKGSPAQSSFPLNEQGVFLVEAPEK